MAGTGSEIALRGCWKRGVASKKMMVDAAKQSLVMFLAQTVAKNIPSYICNGKKWVCKDL